MVNLINFRQTPLNLLINLIQLKKITFLLFLVLCTHVLKAQSGYNYAPYGIAVEVSSVREYTDFKHYSNALAYSISSVYNYSPYLPIGSELQFGTLSGGSNTNKAYDAYGRQSTNSYKALLLHADIQAGEILNYGDSFFLNVIKNFYVGTGFGFIYNDMTFIQRKDPYNPAYGNFPGKDKGVNFILPLRVGYEIKIFNNYDEPAYSINIGYRHNIDFGEGLDGYNDNPAIFKNNAKDQYRQISIGFKVNFGYIIAYNKNIRRF